METFRKVTHHLSYWMNYVGCWVLFLLVLFIATDVVLRYFFSRPITGSFELSGISLAGLVFFGLAYTGVMRGHISVELVVSKLPQRAQMIIDALSRFLAFIIFALIAFAGGASSMQAKQLGEVTDVLGIPLYVPKFFVPVGMGMLSIVFLLQFLESLVGVKDK